MALPQYPADDLNRGLEMLRQLGSFWTEYFDDRDILRMHFRGKGYGAGQVFLDFSKAVAALSRLTVPIFHREDWFLLTLRKTDSGKVPRRFDEAGLEFDQASLFYDQGRTNEPLFLLPEGDFFKKMTDAPYVILNRPLAPSQTWTRGIDYDIDKTNSILRFRENPFDSDLVARREIFDDSGALVDEEIGLWVYGGDFDLEHVFVQFGYAIGLRAKSSEFYRDLLNAIWDGYVRGPTVSAIERAIAAMTGVPLVVEPTETVEVIRQEPERQLVVTDKSTYEFTLAANIIVSVGDVLSGGQEMTDAVQVIEVAGANPDASEIPAISLGPQFITGEYFGELIFPNHKVSVEYLGVDQDDKAFVTFEISGFPADVDAFFLTAQELGKLPGNKTIAELLDLRESPMSQPLPVSLPDQVNPFEFVLDHVMRNNLFFIKLRTSALNPNAPGLEAIRFLRELVPPHSTFVIFVEITPDPDIIDLSMAGDAETPGAEDDSVMLHSTEKTVEEFYVLGDPALPVGAAFVEAATVAVFKTSTTCEE